MQSPNIEADIQSGPCPEDICFSLSTQDTKLAPLMCQYEDGKLEDETYIVSKTSHSHLPLILVCHLIG